MRLVATTMVVALVASVASAAISGEWEYPAIPAGVLDGYVANDLVANTDSDWTQAQLLLTLESGSVFQEVMGGDNPPNPGFFGMVPTLEFDTYLTGGGGSKPGDPILAPGAFGDDASIAGGAVDLGGTPGGKFDTVGIDIGWFTTETNNTAADMLLARITLSDDANGAWALRLSDAAGANSVTTTNGPVVDGFIIPEPATMSLVVLGGLAMLRRRR